MISLKTVILIAALTVPVKTVSWTTEAYTPACYQDIHMVTVTRLAAHNIRTSMNILLSLISQNKCLMLAPGLPLQVVEMGTVVTHMQSEFAKRSFWVPTSFILDQ